MSKLETKLAQQLQISGLAAQYEIHCQYRPIPDRRFKADFCIPAKMLVIECNGGNWVRGRHGRPLGIRGDYARTNLLQVHGWTVLQFDGEQIRSGEAIRTIEEALCPKSTK